MQWVHFDEAAHFGNMVEEVLKHVRYIPLCHLTSCKFKVY